MVDNNWTVKVKIWKGRFAKSCMYLPQPWPQEVTPASSGASPSPRGQTSGPPLSPATPVMSTVEVSESFLLSNTVTCNPSNVNSETFTWARVFAFLPSAQHVLSHQETVPGHCPNLFSPGFGSAGPRIFFPFKYSLFRAQGVPHHWQRYLIQKTLNKLLPSKTDRIAVSVFLLFWLSLTNTEWEAGLSN